jgi:UDP-2-acetamido-3-amino-2,3-dideoxy-glucuronate N-acetyltransferase
VRQGATIGAGAIIGCGLTIGQFAMIGMGSVVTKSVPDFHLVIGNPARSIGCVCRCGEPLLKWDDENAAEMKEVRCQACGDEYLIRERHVERIECDVMTANEIVGEFATGIRSRV